MYDHDYDGLLPKTGKRHLGKTRWTREEVNPSSFVSCMLKDKKEHGSHSSPSCFMFFTIMCTYFSDSPISEDNFFDPLATFSVLFNFEHCSYLFNKMYKHNF